MSSADSHLPSDLRQWPLLTFIHCSHRGDQPAPSADEDQDVILIHDVLTSPDLNPTCSVFLFRQTLISSDKRREPMSSKTAGQALYPQLQQTPSEV